MTVESLTNRQAPYSCDGVTILFALTVPYFNESEITVTLKEIATGDETSLDINVDFEIPGVGDPDEGKIRLIGDYAATPPSSDYTLTIIRILPLSQLMDLIPGAAFNPTNNEAGFDRLVMICQQLVDALNRAAIAKTTSGLSGLVLPVEALKYLRGNAAGNNLEAVDGVPPTNIWRYGSGAPSDALGNNGDYYLNTANGDVYYKTAGTWGAPIANIMGPEGDPGDMSNPMTTLADMIVGGVDGAPARLAKGTGLQCVRMKADASGQEYGAPEISLDTTPQLGGDLDLNQHTMVFAVPGTNLIAVGDHEIVTVAANGVGFGAALYQKSDGEYAEADADAAATMPCTRLALETGTGSKKVLLPGGYIRNDAWAWTTKGAWLFVSVTQGALSESLPGSGKYAQAVAEIKTADIIFFNPSSMQVKAA